MLSKQTFLQLRTHNSKGGSFFLLRQFMTCWDGLRTREKERVLVLAATNRPFDLDEAVLRRFPRRWGGYLLLQICVLPSF